jgi:hypothetical protein
MPLLSLLPICSSAAVSLCSMMFSRYLCIHRLCENIFLLLQLIRLAEKEPGGLLD